MINPERLWKSFLEALVDVASIYGKPEPIDGSGIIPVEDNQMIDLGKGKGDILPVTLCIMSLTP